MSYEHACKSAADAQGITAIAEELGRRGIPCEVQQTGGFCMVASVPLDREGNRRIACTAHGAGVVIGEDDANYEPLCDTSESDEGARPSIIADAVESWMQSHGAMTLKQWRETAQDESDIGWALQAMGYDPDCDLASEVECAVAYDPGYILRMKDGTYYTAFDRDEVRGTQAEVDLALWMGHARYEVGRPQEWEVEE